MNQQKLEMIFDFSCPYCYLAVQYVRRWRVSKLLDMEWTSLELQPDLPMSGRDATLTFKPETWKRQLDKLQELGKPVSCDFSGYRHIPNTHLAHKALYAAQQAGKADEWVMEVFEALFQGGRNISTQAVLLELAANIGLEEDWLQKAWADEELDAKLVASADASWQSGMEFVPSLRKDGRTYLEGIITFAEFEEMLTEMEKGSEVSED